jgi:lysyl-tRNA synthetase class II
MAELVESMICHVAQTVLGTLKIEHKDAEGNVRKTIDLEGDTSKPAGQRWRRVSMAELVEERTGWKFDKRDVRIACPSAAGELARKKLPAYRDMVIHLGRLLTAVRSHPRLGADERFSERQLAIVDFIEQNRKPTSAKELAEKLGHNALVELFGAQASDPVTEAGMFMVLGAWHELGLLSPAEQLQEIYEKLIEPTLVNPTFVTQVPSVIIPLARRNPADPFFCDVYELAINGQEISPGYTELNDPDVQREKLLDQVGDKEERQALDEDFLTALKYGMPPAGGLGLGIDRLVMMLTGAESIRDVILFPLMRPHA